MGKQVTTPGRAMSAATKLLCVLAALLTVVGRSGARVPIGGIQCLTCTDGCDHPRELTMNVVTETCTEEKAQAPLCVSYFDPVNVRYNYGRGCMPLKDVPENLRENECMLLDVSDLWDLSGVKRKTCVCFCTFSGCNYEPLCYGFGDFNSTLGDGMMAAAPVMSGGVRQNNNARKPWTPLSMLAAVVVFTAIFS